MKLIESKAEYIPQEEGLEGIYKIIELAGRTAYKSEDKMVDTISIDIASLPENITIEDIPNYKDNRQQCIEYLCNHNIKYQVINSAKDFVDRMIKSKHGAALEAGTVYLKVPVETYREDKHEWTYMFPEELPWVSLDCDGKYWYITTNFRHVLGGNVGIETMNKYLCSPTEFHEKRYTMRFTCSRAIAQELTRHRTFSFLMESQRYINYSKERHGGGLTLMMPDRSAWYGSEESEGEAYWSMLRLLDDIEEVYMEAIKCGVQPQIARDILPNATKTELIMTGFSSDWRFLMDLRLFEKTGRVHPDMKDLMQKTQKAMQEAGIWEDIMNKPSKFE